MIGQRLSKGKILSQALFASTCLCLPTIGFSDVVIDYVETNQQKTSVQGNIDITPIGQVTVNGNDAIQMDAADKFVLVEANNIHADAIFSSTSQAINILPGGSNSSVLINSGSSIQGSTNGILVGGSGANISNAGTIEGNLSAIISSATGVNNVVTNTGTIIGGNHAIYVGGNGANISNSGTLTSSLTAVLLAADFTLNNTSTGQILGLGPYGIAINAPITGTITNNGLIVSSNAVSSTGIAILANYNGSITNTSLGTIRAQGITTGQALLLNANFNQISNAGTIEGTNANYGIRSLGTLVGTISNSGVIRATGAGAVSAIGLAGGLTGISNSGTISSNGNLPTIVVSAGSFTNGITNTGTISKATGNAASINLSTAGDIVLNQNAGLITGDVFLAGLTANGNTALNMNGGTITGNIFSSPTKASVINLNGGTITNTLTLGNVPNNVVNLAGTTINTIMGGTATLDTYNLTGGSFVLLDGNGGNDIVNVNANFSIPDGSTLREVGTINVNNNGTAFSVGGVIDIVSGNFNTAVGTYTNFSSTAGVNVLGTLVNLGSTFVGSQQVQMGAVNNSGSLVLGSTGILTVDPGNFQQNAAAAYGVQIQGPNQNGLTDVLSGTATLAANSTVNPTLLPGAFIPENSKFDIIRTPLGGVNDQSTLVQPPNPLIFFEKSPQFGAACNLGLNTCVQLTAHLRPINGSATSDIAQAVAATLDPLFLNVTPTTDQDLLLLFGQLQALISTTDINAALEQLAPGFNYAMIAASHIAMDNAFDNIQLRLEWLKGLEPLAQPAVYHEDRHDLYNGVSYGDLLYLQRNLYGGWVKVYGNIQDQLKRKEIEGYHSESTGFAVGADWAPLDNFIFGVAGSYASVSSYDKTEQRNTLDVESYQATFYSWYQFSPQIYMDAMVGIATHEYDIMRNIHIGTLALNAQGQPYSFQYGAQMDMGYAFLSDSDFFVAPFVRAKYTHLVIGDYTEIGAGGLNLHVENEPLDEQILGVGLRLAAKRDYIDALYVPEGQVILLYDFASEAQQNQSQFLGGGLPFYTNSISPAAFIQIYSVGISAYTSDNYAFTVKLNLEHRDHFFSYNGYMQLLYTWG